MLRKPEWVAVRASAGNYRNREKVSGLFHPMPIHMTVPTREYNVGEIWEITAEPVPETSLTPPHNEDIFVHEKSRLHTTQNTKDLVSAIELLMPPKTGPPQELYEGLLQSYKQWQTLICASQGWYTTL